MSIINYNTIYKKYLIIIMMIIIIIIIIFSYLIHVFNICQTFFPHIPTKKEYKEFLKKCNHRAQDINFKSVDGIKLKGLFVNKYKEPNWNDTIFLYSHGNSRWLGSTFESNQINMLSKFGSIFVYDYRGYGSSEGKISEEGCYYDIIGAWKYLVNHKKIHPNKIIVYGHSLGAAISSYLVKTLINSEINTFNYYPKALILESPFYSFSKIAKHVMPIFSIFATLKFDNNENLNRINGEIPVLIMHSKNDDIIPYNQSLELKNNYKYCKYVEIDGTHNDPIYNDNVYNFITNI